jgi:rapamycin-insensitive companion of mTOR
MEDYDPEIIVKVKGCLWAVGNVGSMEYGAPFLESSDVVQWIVKIAEESEVMSLRGTAFYVLGLISRSLHGQEILLEHGWDGVVNDAGEALGFCLPLQFQKLFTVIFRIDISIRELICCRWRHGKPSQRMLAGHARWK